MIKSLNSLSLRVLDGHLEIIDQTQLPHKEVWHRIEDYSRMIESIKRLEVRGAPLIGVAAALTLAVHAKKGSSQGQLLEISNLLRESRPTAVNLMNCLDVMNKSIGQDPFAVETVINQAVSLFEEDVSLCERMAENGEHLIKDGDNILTHCNTGGLATVGIGTALGVIRRAHEDGKRIHVYVDETRPLLQGGRLTTYELSKLGIPYTLICDNMAGALMAKGKIDRVFLGSDRVALNGDFANKIGTYSVAVLAKYHGVEFYPVAPYTTLDRSAKTGADIPIEQRNASEVRGVSLAIGEVTWSPKDSEVFNPAFDVTPVDLVTGLVMDNQYYSQSELKGGALIEAFKR